jgi:hypothetical protein
MVIVVSPIFCDAVAGGLGRFDLSFCAKACKEVNNSKLITLIENSFFIVQII